MPKRDKSLADPTDSFVRMYVPAGQTTYDVPVENLLGGKLIKDFLSEKAAEEAQLQEKSAHHRFVG